MQTLWLKGHFVTQEAANWSRREQTNESRKLWKIVQLKQQQYWLLKLLQ